MITPTLEQGGRDLVETKPIDGNNGEKKPFGGRRLTHAELQEMSRKGSHKGLCFKCGEKFGLSMYAN